MPKVKVYSTPTCTYCIILKKYLKDKGVEYEDIDITKDIEAQKRMIEKTEQMGTPVVEIGDGNFITGFNKEEIDKALSL